VRRKKISNNRKASLFSFDHGLFFLTILLSFLGILAVADASAPQALLVFDDSYYFAKQQIQWVTIGLLTLLVVTNIDYRYWKKMAIPFFLLSLVLLIIVILPGIGSKVLGARRWISLGFFSIQPSEVVKLSLAILIAHLADEKYPFTKLLGIIGFVAFMIMLQPDLGTTIVIASVGIAQLFIAGIPTLYLLGSFLVGGFAVSLLVLFSDYRRQRLMTFFESSTDPLGSSYHMRQILLALGSGGLFGVGLGRSRQKQLFLPETASDSVFAVIAEEIGFVGSVILIILLIMFVLKIFRVARFAPDKFSMILASGIGVWISGQMFLNISSMVAITPLTGIPLPFFSYGGSSLVMILFAIGILLNISKHKKDI